MNLLQVFVRIEIANALFETVAQHRFGARRGVLRSKLREKEL